jgi:hypothetical protein
MQPGKLVVLALVVAAPADAAAGELACQLAEPGFIDVDGMLDDWDGVAHARTGGKDKDASFDVRCVTDGSRLAIAIDVRDDVLSRRRKPAKGFPGEDRVVVDLSAGAAAVTMTLFPGTEKVAPRRDVAGAGKARKGKLPAGLTIEDSARPKGWAIELELPLAKIPGWSAAAAAITARVVLQDADELHDRPDGLVSDLTLRLGEQPQLYERFLRDVRLRKKDVRLDQLADVDPAHPGTERVVAGGKILGVIAEQYGYVELPVAAAADVLAVQLVDLRGDGSRVILTHLRQHGGGGSRDLVVLWGADGGRIDQLFAIEVRKEADGNRLESTWTVVKAGTRRKKGKKKPSGTELVIEAGKAIGWDEDSFDEISADDAEPIHRPWDRSRTGGVYWLDGATVRSQALGKKKG